MPSNEPLNKNNKDCSEEATGAQGKKTLRNGGGCSHLDFDRLFIKTEDGCIVRCAECKSMIIRHCPCTNEEVTSDADASGLMPCTNRRAQIFF